MAHEEKQVIQSWNIQVMVSSALVLESVYARLSCPALEGFISENGLQSAAVTNPHTHQISVCNTVRASFLLRAIFP